MKYIFICLISFIPLSLLAKSPVDDLFNSDIKGFCSKLQEAKSKITKTEKEQLNFSPWKIIYYKYFPRSSYEFKKSSVSNSPVKGQSNRQVILAMGIKTTVPESVRAEYLTLTKEMQQTGQDIIELFKTQNESSCIKRAERRNFVPAHYQELQKKLATLTAVKREQEMNAVKTIYSKLPTKLKKKWELHLATQMTDVIEALSDKTISHLMIVSHATSGGHLVDSFENVYPIGLFQDVHEKLRSVSVFSCHASAVIENYDLLKLGPEIFYPESKLTVDELTILPALTSFIKKVEKNLSTSPDALTVPLKECALKIEGKVSGELMVLLNDTLPIAHLTENNLKSYSFDCALLDDEPMLSMVPLKTISSSYPVGNLKISITGPQGSVEAREVQQFRDLGLFKGSLWEVSKN